LYKNDVTGELDSKQEKHLIKKTCFALEIELISNQFELKKDQSIYPPDSFIL
jgi:hypothetical protein